MNDMYDLTIRTRSCLARAGILRVEDIAEMNVDDLKKVRNLGMKSFTEILGFMEAQGYTIDGDKFVKGGGCGPDYCNL